MNWFFIGGNFRSGTTLMHLCLNSHPLIRSFDEPQSYDLLGGYDRALSPEVLSSVPAEYSVGFKVPVKTLELPDIWPIWNERFGAGKCVFMLRDGRQVLASMREMMPRFKDSSFADYVLRNAEARPRMAKFKAAAQGIEAGAANKKLLAASALFWKMRVDMYYTLKAQGLPVLGVWYDDLVTEPERTLRAVLDFLNLEWSDEVLHPELHNSGVAAGGNAVRSIDSASLTKWQQHFTGAQQTALSTLVSPLVTQLQNDNELAGRAG